MYRKQNIICFWEMGWAEFWNKLLHLNFLSAQSWGKARDSVILLLPSLNVPKCLQWLKW
jgi:hypothetical protein